MNALCCLVRNLRSSPKVAALEDKPILLEAEMPPDTVCKAENESSAADVVKVSLFGMFMILEYKQRQVPMNWSFNTGGK